MLCVKAQQRGRSCSDQRKRAKKHELRLTGVQTSMRVRPCPDMSQVHLCVHAGGRLAAQYRESKQKCQEAEQKLQETPECCICYEE